MHGAAASALITGSRQRHVLVWVCVCGSLFWHWSAAGDTCQPRAGPSLKTSRVAAQKYKTNGLTSYPLRALGRHDSPPCYSYSHFPETRVYLFLWGAYKRHLRRVSMVACAATFCPLRTCGTGIEPEPRVSFLGLRAIPIPALVHSAGGARC